MTERPDSGSRHDLDTSVSRADIEALSCLRIHEVLDEYGVGPEKLFLPKIVAEGAGDPAYGRKVAERMFALRRDPETRAQLEQKVKNITGSDILHLPES